MNASWEFSCGDPETGLGFIQDVIRKYPDSYTAQTALSDYYYSVGNVDEAKKAAAASQQLFFEWEQRFRESGGKD